VGAGVKEEISHSEAVIWKWLRLMEVIKPRAAEKSRYSLSAEVRGTV